MRQFLFTLLILFVFSKPIQAKNPPFAQSELDKVTDILSKNPYYQDYVLEVELKNGDYSQCFSIISSENRTIVTSTSEEGLKYGLYEYLYQLGYRFYLPGELWTFTPKISSFNIKNTYNICPDFTSRDFFGTGGFPKGKVNGKFRTDWQDWTTRNNFGGEKLGGHSWQGFIKEYKPILLQHPEYLALLNGERVKPTPTAKFCISNSNLRLLYREYMGQKLNDQIKKFPEKNSYILSADPSDGPGHCTCDNCMAMGSVSNRVFYLANTVAKDYQNISPKAFVNLYAYNKHAYPISFNLEPNVKVQVAPYAFTDFGNPDLLIEEWATKANQIYVRDYWGIPDWSWNLPLDEEYSLSNLEKRIERWKSQGVRGFTIESSYVKFANGPLLYFIAQKSWNKSLTANQFLEEFSYQMFPNAQVEAKKVFNLILNEDLELTVFLNQSSALLQKISTLPLSNKEKQRLNELEDYLNYIYYYERAIFTKSPEDIEILLNFIDHSSSKNILQVNRLPKILKARKFKGIKIKNSSKEVSSYTKSFKELNETSITIPQQELKKSIELFGERSYDEISMKTRTSWYFKANTNKFSFSLKSINSNLPYEFTLENMDTGEIKNWTQIITPVSKTITLNTLTNHTYRLYIKNKDWYFIAMPKDVIIWLEQYPVVSRIKKLYFLNDNFIIRNNTQSTPIPEVYTLKKQKVLGVYLDDFGTYQYSNHQNEILVMNLNSKSNFKNLTNTKLYINPIKILNK